MSEDLFADEVKFPEDLEAMLSMSVHYEKLQSVMRFILDLLKRHEQGLRMAFSKQNVIAPEILTLHLFKDSLENKVVSVEKSLNKTNKHLEDLKQNVESRGDTVETLKFILNTITEHDSAVLSYRKVLAELVGFKEKSEKRIGSLEEGVKKVKEENEKLKEAMKDSQDPQKSFHKSGDTEKSVYKAPNRKYKVNNEGGKHKAENLEIPKAVSQSPSKKGVKDLTRVPSDQPNETFQLTNPNIPPHLQELFTRMINIEKAIEFPSGSREVSSRIGKLESMYKFIEQILDSCEPITFKNRDQIIQIAKTLKTLEKEMAGKLNTEDFDAIKNLVITLASGSSKYDSSSIVTAKEINSIRLLEKKVGSIETAISDIVKIYPENIEEVALKLRRIEQKLQIKAGEDQLQSLQRTVAELAEKIKTLPNVVPKETQKPIDSSLIKSLNRRVSSFEELFRSLKVPPGLDLTQMWEELKRVWQTVQNLSSSFEDFKKQEKNNKDEIFHRLDFKIDSETLKLFDEKLNKQIDGLTDRLSHQFADKIDMRKSIRYLENLLKGLESSKGRPEGDDAMLARKPLVGWSCGSCEKKLECLTGRIASHSPWQRLPLRDASERILKAGPGYSKMLSTLQLDSLRHKSQAEDFLSSRVPDRSITPQP